MSLPCAKKQRLRARKTLPLNPVRSLNEKPLAIKDCSDMVIRCDLDDSIDSGRTYGDTVDVQLPPADGELTGWQDTTAIGYTLQLSTSITPPFLLSSD